MDRCLGSPNPRGRDACSAPRGIGSVGSVSSWAFGSTFRAAFCSNRALLGGIPLDDRRTDSHLGSRRGCGAERSGLWAAFHG